MIRLGALLSLLCTATLHAAPGDKAERTGDEIIVAGQFFHTGAPVVTWLDPGGYDAYRVFRRFSEWDRAGWDATKEDAGLDSPNRYNLRGKEFLSPEQIEKHRGGNWTVEELGEIVDQFVLHFDVCGFSKLCFKVLHDDRCLSVHFMLDVDGTIYQTLDLKERAWHVGIANSRSIGVEIAHIGAYSNKSRGRLDEWYSTDPDGRVRLTVPDRFEKSMNGTGIRTPNFIARPARNEPVSGEIHGVEIHQYDYTPEQYDSLVKLTATLCRIFPNLKCDYPKDENGRLINRQLSEGEFRRHQGLLGHYHVQRNKTDPGPALDWERITQGAQALLAD